MALEDILKALEEESKTECVDIVARSKQSAKRIVAEAKEDAKRVKEDEIAKATSGLGGERAKVINAARLTVKKEVIRAKEEVIQEVFNEVESRLKKLRDSSDYPHIFESLAVETLEGIEGKVKVEVDKKDIPLAKSILEKKGLDYSLDASPTFLAGIKITTDDGRITITNTFDSRLEKAHQFLKSEITNVLFG